VIRRAAFAIAIAVARLAAASPERVVLADADPELQHAVETSLRPYRFEVVVVADVPDSSDAAKQRAEHDGARFVVWRDADELVVFDDRTGVAERRHASTGAFDATGAAAAALSVKTMMRLPPPPDEQPSSDATSAAVAVATTVAEPGPLLRFELGTGARYQSATSLRGELDTMIRPWPAHGWWFGAIGDVGTSESVVQASFKGSWSSWALLAAARFAIDLHPWSIEPWLGAGIERSALIGTEQQAADDDYATLFAVRGGVIGRYRIGRWSFAAQLEAQALPSTPTYTMSHSSAEVFEVPAFAFGGGILVGADLGM
jgi:hypothetical protein